jgi:hypothetical protein
MSVHLEDLLPDYEHQMSDFPAIVCHAGELRVHQSEPYFHDDLPEPLVELLDKRLDMPNVHTLKFAGHPAKHTVFPFTSVKSFMSRLQANGSAQNITEYKPVARQSYGTARGAYSTVVTHSSDIG